MILPGATIGLLGGGQLGRMFTARARTMGYRVWVLDPDPASPAGHLADRHIAAAYTDPEALQTLAHGCQVVTTEFENVPAAALETLASQVRVWPPPAAVAVAQDRNREKGFLRLHGLQTTLHAPVCSEEDVPTAWQLVGGPALLKTSRLGYDGKGQADVTSVAAAQTAFRSFNSVECVLERRLELEAELSVVLARNEHGSIARFPVGQNHHVDGILDTTVVPAALPRETIDEAESVATRVAEALEYVGVLGVELFVANEGRIYVNEIAPRPHNSGHFTQDACLTCQFEQQVRAICGLPLGGTALLSPVAMVNLLGDLWKTGEPRWDRALADPGVKLHLYGKADPRPGRKMGHLNVLAASPAEAKQRALAARRALTDPH
ncbi:MAG TPA: 5-(carboxyamino)imidazole ribonucleotide synthase [Gemmatimonadales bacterium]|nr:5-(carboxyamino)imidazole ribonucleotide synthase [Gemmatimonadales bacterium]